MDHSEPAALEPPNRARIERLTREAFGQGEMIRLADDLARFFTVMALITFAAVVVFAML